MLCRLHSACFTGDLLGSLKCDCGPQLHAALEQIGAEGSGVLLYLNQEGRGIGLANKMRAYALQDQGFDTVEANHRLGFEDDERDFRIGADILRSLGFRRVRLMTNNPKKVEMMRNCGLEVVERVPLKVGRTRFNADYLAHQGDQERPPAVIRDLVVGPWGARFAGRRFPCATGRGGIGDQARRGRPGHAGRPAPDRGGALAPGPWARAAARGRPRGFPIGPRDGWSDDPRRPGLQLPRSAGRMRSATSRCGGATGSTTSSPCSTSTAHPAVPGKGSAIFLHLWRGPRRPTAGCVAFRRPDLAWILAHWNRRSRVVVGRWA